MLAVLLCDSLICPAAGQTGPFSEATTTLPASTFFPSASWADFDNDGDLDVLLGGILYRNDGGGIFSLVTTNFPPGGRNAVAWGDHDRDGDLDLFIAGSGPSRLYRNDGGVFVEINAGFPLVSLPAAAWGDFDNDGDLDLLLTGIIDSGTAFTALYRNDGNGRFVSLGGVGLPQIYAGSLAWGDFDRDGNLDVLVSGFSATDIYRNNGNGTFSALNAGLRRVYHSSSAWGDYDGDGRLDILCAGFYSGNYVLDVYRNFGNGVFTNINVGLQGIAYGSTTWADFDQDGDLDILLGGSIANLGADWITKLYQNNGDHTFSNLTTVLPDTRETSLVWGDFDGDGDLDILMSGIAATPLTKIFRNNSSIPNTPPTPPGGLSAVVMQDNEVFFQWNTPADPQQTNGGGLSYRLRLGTGPGLGNLVSPHADAVTGFGRLPERGPIATNAWRLRDVPKGMHYWSVQAVDAGFAGSLFSVEAVLEVTNARPTIFGPSNVEVIPNQTAGPLTFTVADEETPAAALVVTATSSDQTVVPDANIILGGSGASRTVTVIPASNQSGRAAITLTVSDSEQWHGSNTFVVAVEQFTVLTLDWPGGGNATPSWGDYDDDNDLDLLVFGGPGYLYRNGGSNRFVISGPLPFVPYPWHTPLAGRIPRELDDFNHDGFVDFALFGEFSTLGLYRNNLTGTFSRVGAPFPSSYYDVSLDWGDYDNDGDSDLLVTGRNGYATNGVLTRVYRNEDGGAAFTEASADLLGIGSGAAVWTDFDNDGWLDVLITGTTNSRAPPGAQTNFAGIFRNNRLGGFDPTPVSLPPVVGASVAVADFDSDGDADFALSGFIDWTNRVARIYRNDGAWIFTDIGAPIPWTVEGTIAWGDYDNDGRPDLLASGTTNGSQFGAITRILRNNGAGGFTEMSGVLPGMWSGGAVWGDFDNDGDLDIATAGRASTYAPSALLLRNNQPSSNQPPTAPAFLTATVSGNQAQLNWAPATDAETPAPGLTYNLRVGTNPGGSQIVAPLAGSSGFRRVTESGNTGSATGKLLRQLRRGTYYWSVQTVDAGFAGSPFSAEETFTITNPLPPWFDVPPVVRTVEDAFPPPQSCPIRGISAGDAVNGFNVTFSNASPTKLYSMALSYNAAQHSGELSFQLLPNANGTGTVTVTASGLTDSGETLSFTRECNVVMVPVQDAPYVFFRSTNGIEDTPLTFMLPANDPDGDPLSYTLLGAPRFGTLTGSGFPVTYHPTTNFFGFDSFTFRVSDGITNSEAGFVSIFIAGTQDVTNVLLTLQPFTNGSYQVRLSGEPYQRYALDVSSNLVSWTNLATFPFNSNGVTTWIDVPPVGARQRFYRGRTF